VPRGPTGGHGERLPGVLLELLAEAGHDLCDVAAYAVGLGPGSFTGLRIGLATWKGLAYGQRRPLAGVSSLAAMALGAAASAPDGALLVPLLDARKGELYAGFYLARAGAVEVAAPEVAIPPAALADRLAKLAAEGARPLVFGDGLSSYPSVVLPHPHRGSDAAPPALPQGVGHAAPILPLPAGGERVGERSGLPLTPPALAVSQLCASALVGASYDAPRLFALEPHYIRASEAELRYPHGHAPGTSRPKPG
jgi:tRNA threonylcarbamoyladenosine biosynthesis protein TsaB